MCLTEPTLQQSQTKTFTALWNVDYLNVQEITLVGSSGPAGHVMTRSPRWVGCSCVIMPETPRDYLWMLSMHLLPKLRRTRLPRCLDVRTCSTPNPYCYPTTSWPTVGLSSVTSNVLSTGIAGRL